jgi:hypothetical protein
MKIYCLPEAALPRDPDPTALRFSLYGRSILPGVGVAGLSLWDQIRRAQLTPVSHAWDLLTLALGVIAADCYCLRNRSPDGWTRQITLVVGVSEPEFWRAQRHRVERLLQFLTGDLWEVQFEGGVAAPGWGAPQLLPQEDGVCLLSGGVDSLIGVLNLAGEGRRPVAVSQVSDGDKDTQRAFAAGVGGGLRHVQLNHTVRVNAPTERSQRARSFIFLAYGVLAATSLQLYRDGGVVELYVPENGFISLNVPLTPLRVGSLSTRTTHPIYIRGYQQLLDAAGLRVRLANPYQFTTKGEMMINCCTPDTLARFAPQATSCGRFKRTGFQHCGRCVPCLIRRAGFLRWGRADTTRYRYSDLSIADPDHREYDDVRSAAMAVEMIRQKGSDAWVGGSLDSTQLGDVAPYMDLLNRGISELAHFLETQHVL